MLGVIAERYGVPLETIMADNGLADETAISVGQIITINGRGPRAGGRRSRRRSRPARARSAST